jgi:hypothetical protein
MQNALQKTIHYAYTQHIELPLLQIKELKDSLDLVTSDLQLIHG